MTLVRIVSNYDAAEWIRRSTPGGSGRWGDITFTADPVDECDYCIFQNGDIRYDVSVTCPPENIWMLVHEPYMAGLNDWVIDGHGAFARIYTHRRDSGASIYWNLQTALPWHVRKTYDELKAMTEPPEKTRQLSAIIGGARDLPGHQARYEFIQALKKSDLPLDFFGRAVRPIDDKADALEPYGFSLAIENNSNPDMWTEKLADCFLSWTVPFYFGCTNLDNYFPAGSYIPIDISNPERSIDIIRDNLSSGNWGSRIDALREARTLILEKYQLCPFIADQINTSEGSHAPVKTIVPAYKRSFRAAMSHRKYKLERSLRKRMTDKPW